jgi:hypothetical protein
MRSTWRSFSRISSAVYLFLATPVSFREERKCFSGRTGFGGTSRRGPGRIPTCSLVEQARLCGRAVLSWRRLRCLPVLKGAIRLPRRCPAAPNRNLAGSLSFFNQGSGAEAANRPLDRQKALQGAPVLAGRRRLVSRIFQRIYGPLVVDRTLLNDPMVAALAACEGAASRDAWSARPSYADGRRGDSAFGASWETPDELPCRRRSARFKRKSLIRRARPTPGWRDREALTIYTDLYSFLVAKFTSHECIFSPGF